MVIYMTSPRLRSGAVAERSYPASKVRGSSRECQDATALEQPYVRGQGQRLEGATPCLRPGREVGRTNPMPEARGGGQEEQPHIQGAVAAQVQKGLEELSNVEGQERRW